MRLQKYMALCGVASRRRAEEMIAAGQVQVNGVTITEMGTQVEEEDEVRVDGQIIHPEAEKRYVIYHKPAGEVTTVNDPEGRACVLDHFRDYPVRLYPVGRLDYDSEGLLLLTNDGALTERLLHPSHQVDKTYLARVTGSVSLDTVRMLRQGVMLDDHKTAPAKVRIVKTETFATVVLVTIHEGRNRQVRRMMDAVGHRVVMLRRVRFGPLELGGLRRGDALRLYMSDGLVHTEITGTEAVPWISESQSEDRTDEERRTGHGIGTNEAGGDGALG